MSLPHKLVRIDTTKGLTQVLQSLDQHPRNLAAEADIPKIRQPRSRNAKGVRKAA
jgi:hypothetical protein